MENRFPEQPSEPPYTWHGEASNCAVQIASGDPLIIDKFSFAEARALATEVIEVCEERGGCGGYALIGRDRAGWEVKAIGFSFGQTMGNGTVYTAGLISDN